MRSRVGPKSTTETFVAVRLAADNWRWEGVPILIRAGKCMPVTATEVDIRFKRPPHDVFGIGPFAVRDSLRFRIGQKPRSASRWRARSRAPESSRCGRS